MDRMVNPKPATPPPDYEDNQCEDSVQIASSLSSSHSSLCSDDPEDVTSYTLQEDCAQTDITTPRNAPQAPAVYQMRHLPLVKQSEIFPRAASFRSHPDGSDVMNDSAVTLHTNSVYEPSVYQESENEYDHLINSISQETMLYEEGQSFTSEARGHVYKMKRAAGGSCIRCHKRVYPAERVGIEIGVMLHKNCFKCGKCGVTLSLNTFVLAPNRETVLCKSHAPKAGRHTLDPSAFAIRNAVKAQRIHKQDSVNCQVRLRDTNGWQYDPRAKEFEHLKTIQEMNKVHRPHHYDVKPDKMDYESGDVIRQLREGVLKRDKVKDLAASITNMRMYAQHDADVTDSDSSFEKGFSAQYSFDTDEHDRSNISDSDIGSRDDLSDVTSDMNRSYEYLRSITMEPDNDWRQVLKDERRNEAKFEPLKVVTEGCVLRLKESFQNEAQFQIQHELEMRQREEQQEIFKQIDQSRQATLVDTIPEKEETPVQKVLETGKAPDVREVDDVSETPTAHDQPEDTKASESRRLKNEELLRTLESVRAAERERFQEMSDRQTHDMLLLTCNKPLHDLPPPGPPRGRKKDILSSDMLTRVDIRVMQIASYEPGSFTELVYQLTDDCNTDLEKVRAIFRWITLKDLNKVCFESELNPNSPYFFLKGIKYGLESYHELFRRLCSYTGIPVQIIRGLSKSAGYSPGIKPTNDKFRNIWSAAYIDENWRFIDCHWGARHVERSRVTTATNGVFCYSLDEFFFLTDPEDLIYMHLPDDPKWQLLGNPVDFKTFLEFPVVKSTFFQYHLKFIRDSKATLYTENGLVDVIIRKTNTPQLIFNTRLERGAEQMTGHCIYQNAEAGVVFHVNLPYPGDYIFTIFACERGVSDVFSNICSFRLVSTCDDIERNLPSRFPLLPDGYGLLPIAADFGIETESHRGFYLVSDKEKMILNIKFDCALNISQKYCKGGEIGETNDIELARHFFQRYRDHNNASYLLRFPAPGFYVFSLFAAKRGSGSQLLECACRYIIHCTSQRQDHVIKIYPKVLQHWIRCRLYEPTHGDLKVNKNVKFKIEAYNATAVAVIVNQQWFYLKQGESPEEKAKNIWTGVAHTGKDTRHKLEVYGRFKGNAKDFFPLLEYRLIEDI